MSLIQESISHIQAQIKLHKTVDVVTLVAVTKNRTIDEIKEAYNCGIRDFGENRLQEVEKKISLLPNDIRWHLIGSLQSNKIRKAVGLFSLIHSVDSVECARKISEVSVEKKIITSILLQVNVSKELTKHGFYEEDLISSFQEIAALPAIKIKGLMTMAPKGSLDQAKACFHSLNRDAVGLKMNQSLELSMGMSCDYVQALEEGATILRIGSAIFEK